MTRRNRRNPLAHHHQPRKETMKKLLFALTILAGSAFGQSAVINNFTALIKGVTIGTSHCYFWGQSPGASQVQAACYTNGVILKNTIQTVTTPNDEQCFGIGGTAPNFVPVSRLERGAHGGYTLARAADEIRVGEVYRAMEGPVAPMDCVSENLSDQTCPLIPGCQTRPVWIKVRDSIIDAIDSITLADLLEGPTADRVDREPVAITAS